MFSLNLFNETHSFTHFCASGNRIEATATQVATNYGEPVFEWTDVYKELPTATDVYERKEFIKHSCNELIRITGSSIHLVDPPKPKKKKK